MDNITAIKVIGTALNKPNLPYIIFCKVDNVQPLILFLKIDVFTSLTESGTSSHIFGATNERLTSIMDCEILIPFKN